MTSSSTTTAEFFESLYQKCPDPWNFTSSAYEHFRYNQILTALAHKHYKNVFEPGCSIGVLTEQLSKMSDHVFAIDVSETAINAAVKRCEHLDNVTIQQGHLIDYVLNQKTDLILLSEIGYYFEVPQLTAIVLQLLNQCETGTTLLASHWLGHSNDHILSGDTVHQVIQDIPGLQLEYSKRHLDFRLDRWVWK